MPKPESSIVYRWAIDSGVTHEEAIHDAKEAIAQQKKRRKLTPKENLEETIKRIREVEADLFGWTQEEIDKRINQAIHRSEITIRCGTK